VKQTLIIAAREVRQRMLIVGAAAVLATFPFLVLGLKVATGQAQSMDYIGVVGAVAAVAFSVILAIILGATMVGSDLSERRLSFYFARPVGGAAIWFGKLTGSLAVVAVSFALIFVPSWIAGRRTWGRELEASPSTVVMVSAAAFVLALLAAHVSSTIFRSQSAVVAGDIAATFVLGTAVWFMVLALAAGGAIRLAAILLGTLFVLLLVAMIGAGAWQLSRGRTDLRRSHLEMSRFLWIALAAIVVAAGVYVAWVVSADPEDLDLTTAHASGRGDWVAIAGGSRMRGDYRAAFLVGPRGQSVRIAAAGWSGPHFTPAGHAAITIAPRVQWRPELEVVVHRFGRDQQPLHTGVRADAATVLSDDLSRLAVVGSAVSIHDLDGDRLVASARLPRGRGLYAPEAFFVSPDVLRIFTVHRSAGGGATLVISEIDVRTRRLVQTGEWSTPVKMLLFRANADGSRLLVSTAPEEGSRFLLILDGRTAAIQAKLPVNATVWHAWFMSDGRVLALTPRPNRVLQVFTPEGAHVRDIEIGSGSAAYLDRELSQGRVVLSVHSGQAPPRNAEGWETAVVDVDRGAVIRRAANLRPAFASFGADPRAQAPNEVGEIIATDSSGKAVRWNFETGEKRPLIGG
jgi:hypothetical protein